MVIFVDAIIKSDSIILEIRGEKSVQISGASTSEVCVKLMQYVTREDCVYVDCRGIGTAVADLLSRLTTVIRLHLTSKDMIKD